MSETGQVLIRSRLLCVFTQNIQYHANNKHTFFSLKCYIYWHLYLLEASTLEVNSWRTRKWVCITYGNRGRLVTCEVFLWCPLQRLNPRCREHGATSNTSAEWPRLSWCYRCWCWGTLISCLLLHGRRLSLRWHHFLPHLLLRKFADAGCVFFLELFSNVCFSLA